MNLSSIVVQAKPGHLEALVDEFKSADSLCEYHLHDESGKIVVTIEGKTVEEEISKLQTIQGLPNVITAEMVFSYSEDELESNRALLEKNKKIPDWLNDPNAKISDIKYNGDLKGKY